jgi:hypothetical protein
LQQVFATNVLAPYILTALMLRLDRAHAAAAKTYLPKFRPSSQHNRATR